MHCRLKYRVNSNCSAGFTLAELLIVVAIILVLVAIAVPVFAGASASAQEATCAGNRHTVKVIVSNAYMMDNDLDDIPGEVAKAVEQLMAQNGNKDLCPAGGEYSLKGDGKNGSIIIQCSKHGISVDDELANWIDSNRDSWMKYTGDSAMRKAYQVQTGKETWPTVEGDDGTLYLKFKSYDTKQSGIFLYATTRGPKITDSDQWKADYICDTNGLAGTAGQWYKVPKNSNIAINDEKAMQAFLTANNANTVSLVNGKFVAN